MFLGKLKDLGPLKCKNGFSVQGQKMGRCFDVVLAVKS
jgi:hypothetical protein